MDWDLGFEGLAYLAAMSVLFGVGAHLVAGRGMWRWLWLATTAAVFAGGLLMSEVFFGWATEEDLQPNIDGLSRDEALLSSLLIAVAAVVLARRLRGRTGRGRPMAGTA